MITRTIEGILTNGSGEAQADAKIRWYLVDESGSPVDGWDVADGERIVPGPVDVVTDGTGAFSVPLWPTSRGEKILYWLCKTEATDVDTIYAPLTEGAGPVLWRDWASGGVVPTPQQLDILTAHLANANLHFNWRGAYNGATQYSHHDAVSYAGSSWKSLTANIGVAPVEGANWTVIAAKGDQGVQGIQGVQGLQGLQGLTGNPYKSYATLALATGDLANIPADALIWVNNDGTNSGYYSKTGGVLVASPNDRVALVENRATALESDKTITVSGKNMFNSAAVSSGCYLAATGATAVTASRSTSEFIPVNYATNTNVRCTSYRYSAQYDVNKTFIAGTYQALGADAAGTIALNANAKFLRITVADVNLATTQVEYGTANTAYEAYKPEIKTKSGLNAYVYKALHKSDETTVEVARLDGLAISLDNRLDVLEELPLQYNYGGKNMFNSATVTQPWRLSGSGAGSADAGYATSEFIRVDPLTAYYGVKIYRVEQYDSAKVFIAGTYQALAGPMSITTNAAAAYIRITTLITDLAACQVEIGAVGTFYVPFDTDVVVSKTKTGKNLLFQPDLPANSSAVLDRLVQGAELKLQRASRNLYDHAARLTNTLLATTAGTTTTSAGYITSDWIRMEPSTQYHGRYIFRLSEYDKDKNFIKATNNASHLPTAFTTDPSTAYIRFCTNDAYAAIDQIELGTTYTVLEAYSPDLVVNQTQSGVPVTFNPTVSETYPVLEFEQSKNIFNYLSATNSSLVGADGQLVYGNTDWGSSTLIPITPAAQYTFSEVGRIAQYDTNKAFIAGTYIDNVATFHNPVTVVTNASAAYIRVSVAVAYYQLSQIELGAVSTIYMPHYLYVRKSGQNERLLFQSAPDRWIGKSWLALGDSVTAREDYQPWVAAECGFATVTTDAISGIPTREMTDRITAGSLSGVDLVTIFAPFNDFGGSTVLGSMADAPGTTTFYAAVKKCIDDILSIDNSVSIAMFGGYRIDAGPPFYPTGMYTANSLGLTLDDYLTAMSAVCKHYGIPFCNLSETSGINEYNLSVYCDDGLHANQTGMKMIASVMAAFINTQVGVKP